MRRYRVRLMSYWVVLFIAFPFAAAALIIRSVDPFIGFAVVVCPVVLYLLCEQVIVYRNGITKKTLMGKRFIPWKEIKSVQPYIGKKIESGIKIKGNEGCISFGFYISDYQEIIQEVTSHYSYIIDARKEAFAEQTLKESKITQ